ncbi:NADPH-dependent FMN reductase [Ramlibacter sp. AN1015]|uniref:NADPH-dependent FMN reductase n=1 Tax=Ramlibacter sp. AN1015 TaxID=3133428 RepID=UPI0030C3DB79
MESRNKRIVGLCGSLRAGSYNAMAMRLAAQSLPQGAEFEALDWRAVPPFDADVLARGMPQEVTAIRERVRQADGVVIVTPEYNYSIPGMLKNLIDWLSRGDDQPFAGKPVAILSATTGPLGGARVQYDLRKVMLFVNAMVLVKPEVFIGQAQTKFDADGRCTDEATGKFVAAQMQAFSDWIDRVARMRG